MLVNDGGTATQPRAPGHDRPFTASAGAAEHGRLSAASTAPGADVPPATPAGAPGQYCLCAAHLAPGHGSPLASKAGAPCRDRLRAAHLAPGHERPHVALPATWPGRPSAATRAPGADVPPAIPAEAPGQYCLCAAHLAPGHERPHVALPATWPGRPSAATRAPGADVPPATPAEAPGQHRLRAVANATVALPAGQPRLSQEGLPHNPANPRTLIYPHTHQHTAPTHTRRSHSLIRHSRESGNPRPPVLTGGPQGGYAPATRPIPLSFLHSRSSTSSLRPSPQSSPRPTPSKAEIHPLSKCWRGGRGVRSTFHQVQPAIQVPPHPRPCSTAATGLHRHHPSRAPPTLARRSPTRASPYSPSPNVGEGAGG